MTKTLLCIILSSLSDLVLGQGTLGALNFSNHDASIGFASSKNSSTSTNVVNGALNNAHKINKAAGERNTFYDYEAPSLIKNDNDHDSIRYAEFVAPLYKALKDLTAQLEAQQQEIKALERQLGTAGRRLVMTGDSTRYKGVALYQNYPNLLSMETEIKVSLPKSTDNANLIFYTMEGKQLKVLHLFNRGDFIVKIDSRELGIGTCFYALMVEGKIIDSRRLLVKRRS